MKRLDAILGHWALPLTSIPTYAKKQFANEVRLTAVRLARAGQCAPPRGHLYSWREIAWRQGRDPSSISTLKDLYCPPAPELHLAPVASVLDTSTLGIAIEHIVLGSFRSLSQSTLV